ncbi:MAG: HEPN domain-containing protein [Candidatus Nezhaarchaeales archaeon]
MRVEVEWWLKQSKRDLKMAEELFKSGFFEGAAYHSHQAGEKALKALVIHKRGYHLTHSCKFLLDQLRIQGLEVNESLYGYARELDVHYLTSRYPNAASAPPYELYDGAKAKELIESARRLLSFVEENLK